MKILFVVPGGQDLGGIITSTEQYVAGLKELGHEVTFMTAAFTVGQARSSSPKGKFANDFIPGPGTGQLYHTTQGWRGELRLSLINPADRAQFITMAKKYDVIIWASMYGFRNPSTEGRSDWAEIFPKLKGKYVFMIHDDHIRDRYPWAFGLAKYASIYIGVQPCSYDSLEGVAAPRAIVYTPLAPTPGAYPLLEERSGYFMCQVWKGWKNGDKLVAAAPYMPKNSVTFAGDGIQLRYLRSKDKCPLRWEGFWDAAMKKQRYVGVLSEDARDLKLCQSKFLVDLSLRHNSGQYNRIVQEAMARGCVVIADPRFITGTAGLFVPMRHYLPIDAELPPEQLAKALKSFDKTDPSLYRDIQRNAKELVTNRFERTSIAERLISCIITGSFVDGVVTPEMKKSQKMGEQEFVNVFGGRP